MFCNSSVCPCRICTPPSYRCLCSKPALKSSNATDLTSCYLSLTDYIQHKYAPEEPAAMRFYRDIDERFGRLAALGALVALTADHGMNDKSRADGLPNVIWLQDILDRGVRCRRH